MQANVEYFFRLLYECFHGACYGSVDASGLMAWIAHLWVWITGIGYAFSIIALFIIIYCMVRLFELRKREDEYYSTLIVDSDATGESTPRWEHILKLSEGSSPSEWKEAIIEADTMLDDVLIKQGYVGAGLGEKLKTANAEHFGTLQDAWEAHKVRNQIAHQGSTFALTDTLARRTIARYEAVFKKFKVI